MKSFKRRFAVGVLAIAGGFGVLALLCAPKTTPSGPAPSPSAEPPRGRAVSGAASLPKASAPARAAGVPRADHAPPHSSDDLPATLGERTRIDKSPRDPIARAQQALESVALQDPAKFLEVFAMMERTGEHPQRYLDEAREATRTYLERRTELLAASLLAFLDSDGEVTETEELSELRSLEQAFTAHMDELEQHVPGLSSLPRMIANTSHRLPFFAASSAADASGERTN